MGTTAWDLMVRDENDDEEGEEDDDEGEKFLVEEEAPTRTPSLENEVLVHRCRICANFVPAGLRESAARIFSEEGRKRNLQRNIQKYLYIMVSCEDKLPKIVCASCIGKLDDIHAFAGMALNSQEKLKQELFRTPADSAVTVDSSNSSDTSTNKLGERGLLHSILTKGSEALNDRESIQGRQRTPSTEEMEVKVDPMLFLQCALDRPSSADCSDCSDYSDRDISNYCNSASEPLSLINKNHEKEENTCKSEVEIRKNCDNNDNENLNNIDKVRNIVSDEEDEFESDDTSNRKLKPHVCKICARAYSSQIVLQNHLWSHLPTTTNEVHGSVEKNSALRNEKVFGDANGIVSQNNSCSDNNLLSGNFICPICGKKISTKGNLKVHLETHRPKGKYGCDICGRIFKTQSNLFRHKEYHSGIQFPCSVCGRVYPTNSTLRAHSITHSDLRPHACPLCDKTFKRNQDLKFHINQHTGARPYQCPYCPKAFASSGNCFSHRKRMHPKEVHRDRQRAADLMR